MFQDQITFAVLRVILAAVLILVPASSPASALTLKPSGFTVLSTSPVMRVLLVHAAGACGHACPEWISAEGRIAPETVGEFNRLLKSLGKRKPPVFVHSPGGNIVAALAIGRLLRAHRIDIAVTRTRFQTCQGDCRTSGYNGVPQSTGAVCASACAYLIAGGVRRFVSPGSLVGVHDGSLPPIVQRFAMTTTDAKGREIELGYKNVVYRLNDLAKYSPKLQQAAEQLNEKSRSQIEIYNREMGVGAMIAEIAVATKPPAIHWLSRSELSDSHLMTDASGGEDIIGVHPAVAVPPTAPAADALTRDERSR